jgi:hypothetical protein
VIREETLQKVDDPPRSRCVLTLSSREWARNQGEECAVDQRIAVDQKEPRAGRWGYVCHERFG